MKNQSILKSWRILGFLNVDPGSLITHNLFQIYLALLSGKKKKKKIVKIVEYSVEAGLYNAKTMLQLNVIETESLTVLHNKSAWEILKKQNSERFSSTLPFIVSSAITLLKMQIYLNVTDTLRNSSNLTHILCLGVHSFDHKKH